MLSINEFAGRSTCRRCPRCDGTRWVCEAHPHMPWSEEHNATCGAPGEPCPVCNVPYEDETPDLPEGFRVDIDDKGWRHWWLKTGHNAAQR